MNYRAYILINTACRASVQTVQASHSVHELFTKYKVSSPHKSVLYEWAENHKTIILLNGGNQTNLISIQSELLQPLTTFKLPYSEFREPDLNNTLTSICMILPERFYAGHDYDAWGECSIYERISKLHLAP